MSTTNYRFFAVHTDQATEEQRNKLTDWLDANKQLGYWHWVHNFWIIADPYDTSSAHAWRLKAEGFMPNAYIFVAEITAAEWSGKLPTAGNQWLINNMNGRPTV